MGRRVVERNVVQHAVLGGYRRNLHVNVNRTFWEETREVRETPRRGRETDTFSDAERQVDQEDGWEDRYHRIE